jgi:hypothetical protein
VNRREGYGKSFFKPQDASRPAKLSHSDRILSIGRQSLVHIGLVADEIKNDWPPIILTIGQRAQVADIGFTPRLLDRSAS